MISYICLYIHTCRTAVILCCGLIGGPSRFIGNNSGNNNIGNNNESNWTLFHKFRMFSGNNIETTLKQHCKQLSALSQFRMLSGRIFGITGNNTGNNSGSNCSVHPRELHTYVYIYTHVHMYAILFYIGGIPSGVWKILKSRKHNKVLTIFACCWLQILSCAWLFSIRLKQLQLCKRYTIAFH